MNLRLVKAVSKWRAQFNPLRSLTFQRAVTMLEDGERGAYADLQWTYRFIEKRDATLRALVKLRTSAIKKLDWDIKTVEDTPAAKAQAGALRQAYDRIDNLKAAIGFLALAEFRGFSHLEKCYEGDNPAGAVVHLCPVPQWHWCRDTMYGPWQYNADAANTNRGAPIIPRHFIIREVEAPINEIGFLAFLRKNLSQKDWDGFVETYGIPPLFAEMPANVPAGKEDEYQEMAEAVIGDMRGTLPNGAKIHTVDAGARGANPFRDHLTYQDEQLVLAGTSGKLTMLNGPTGLGGGQSEVHQDTFDDLAQAEAAEISEIFQKQFDRATLDLAGFAGQPALAYFELAAQDKTDVGQVLDHAVKASQAGMRIDAGELSEKTGYKIAVAPVPPAQPSGFGFGAPAPRTLNRASPVSPANEAVRNATRAAAAKALAEKLKPVREALQAASDASDDKAFDAALEEARATILAEGKKLGLTPDDPLVKALEDGMSAALLNGATASREAVTENRGGLRG